jgi:hypothetical protein
MTVLPADHRADLQKIEKIADEPASLETEEEFESLFPNCAKGSDAANWQPLRFADLRGQKIDPGRLHRFRKRALTPTPSSSTDRGYEQIVKPRVEDPEDGSLSMLTWRSKCIPSSEPEIAGQKDRGAMRVWTAAIPSTDNLFQLPASRTRGPGALGSNGQVMSAPATTRTTEASPTTPSTYYSGLNCVTLWCSQRFGSSGFRA